MDSTARCLRIYTVPLQFKFFSFDLSSGHKDIEFTNAALSQIISPVLLVTISFDFSFILYRLLSSHRTQVPQHLTQVSRLLLTSD